MNTTAASRRGIHPVLGRLILRAHPHATEVGFASHPDARSGAADTGLGRLEREANLDRRSGGYLCAFEFHRLHRASSRTDARSCSSLLRWMETRRDHGRGVSRLRRGPSPRLPCVRRMGATDPSASRQARPSEPSGPGRRIAGVVVPSAGPCEGRRAVISGNERLAVYCSPTRIFAFRTRPPAPYHDFRCLSKKATIRLRASTADGS
jgi:hypothetical protein